MSIVLRQVIELASRSRSRLPVAIGLRNSGETGAANGIGESLPTSVRSVYAIAEGTRRDIADQSLMDIVPGYRLIHLDELEEATRSCHSVWPESAGHVPFLADYSGCYYLVRKEDGIVEHLDRVEGFAKVASSLDAYWETVRRCYADGVYFLDADGYLDYDFEREGALGANANPGCAWWTDTIPRDG